MANNLKDSNKMFNNYLYLNCIIKFIEQISPNNPKIDKKRSINIF
jgi:hypothetical protein